MFEAEAFRIDEVTELHALIDELPVAHLVTVGENGIASSMLPLVLDRSLGPLGTLLGHLARPNPDWRTARPDALAIFTGPDAYISPSGYPSKVVTGKVVPTWNYLVVHAHGELTVHDDPEWTRGIVTRLTDRHEQGRPEPWAITDAPAAYIDAMLRGIIGIELRLTRLVGKAKASQNRSEPDRLGAIAALALGTPREHEMAKIMDGG